GGRRGRTFAATGTDRGDPRLLAGPDAGLAVDDVKRRRPSPQTRQGTAEPVPVAVPTPPRPTGPRVLPVEELQPGGARRSWIPKRLAPALDDGSRVELAQRLQGEAPRAREILKPRRQHAFTLRGTWHPETVGEIEQIPADTADATEPDRLHRVEGGRP